MDYITKTNKIKIEALLQQEGYDQKHIDAIIGVIGTVLGAGVIGGMTKGMQKTKTIEKTTTGRYDTNTGNVIPVTTTREY